MAKVTSTTAVRPQIKAMISPSSNEEFEKSLPVSTAEPAGETPVGEPIKRKRRSKEEMAALRGATGGQVQAPEVDPLMSDPEYKRIMDKMTGAGGKKVVSAAFSMSGKPLRHEEEKEFDEQFYVISKKLGYSPANSWFAILFYFFFAVVLPAIVERTDLAKQFKALFEKANQMPSPKKDAPKETVEAPQTIAEAMMP